MKVPHPLYYLFSLYQFLLNYLYLSVYLSIYFFGHTSEFVNNMSLIFGCLSGQCSGDSVVLRIVLEGM